MKMQFKHKNILSTVMQFLWRFVIAVIVSLSVIVLVEYKDNYINDYLTNTDLMTLVDQNDTETKGKQIIITGDDPYLIYKLSASKGKSLVKLTFAESLSADLKLKLFWANEKGSFNESESTSGILTANNTETVFQISDSNDVVSNVRIDLEGLSFGNTVPTICTVQIQNFTLFTKLIAVLNWLIDTGRFVLSVLISLTVIFLIELFVYLKKQRHGRKSIIIEIIILSAAFCVPIIIVVFGNDLYSKHFVNESSHKLRCIDFHDLRSLNDGTFQITGQDPYLVFAADQNYDVLNAKITLNQKVAIATQLDIYYQLPGKTFSQEKSFSVPISTGSNEVIFKLPEKCSISKIRVDYSTDQVVVSGVKSLNVEYSTEKIVVIEQWLLSGVLIYSIIISLIISSLIIIFLHNNNGQLINEDLLAVLIIITAMFFLYNAYIIGDRTYIFTDVAGDSSVQVYPTLLNVADRIYKGIWKEFVNFSEGLGNSTQSLTIDSNNWVSLFGNEHVASLMGISQYLKVIIAGIAAYFWAKLYSKRSEIALIIGLSYSCWTEFTVRGNWYTYSTMAMQLAVWLLAFELLFQKKKYCYFPLATVFYFYGLGIYHSIIRGFILAVYILFRFIVDSDLKASVHCLLKTEFIYCFFALFGMADTIIAQLESTLSSNRFISGKSELINIHLFTSRITLFCAYLRTIAASINGITNEYIGFRNFLEDPTFYCGMLTFLLIPAALYNMKNGKRKWYIFTAIIAIAYIVISPIRYFMNGFANLTFKLSSFWISILMLLTFMDILQILYNRQEKKKTKFVFVLTIISTTVLCLISFCYGYISRVNDFIITGVFIAIYFVFFAHYIFPHRQNNINLLTRILTLIVAAEVILTSWSVVNDRNVYSFDDINPAYKLNYNDYTKDAVVSLNDRNSNWFRLEKEYNSVFLCDSLAQGYYGVNSYIGGTEADQAIQQVYDTYGLPKLMGGTNHYLLGTGGNIYISSLLGVKYDLIKNGFMMRYGYKYLKTEGDVNIYQTDYSLPLIFSYNQVIDNKTFERMTPYERGKESLKSAAINSEDFESSIIKNRTIDECDVSNLNEISYQQTGNKFTFPSINDDQVLIITMKFNQEGDGQSIYFSKSETLIGYENLSYNGNEVKTVEVTTSGINTFYLSENAYTCLDSVHVYVANQSQYYAEYISDVRALQRNAMNITYHDDIYNHIEGIIDCTEPRTLASSIPYNDKWKIIVDGNEVKTIVVNESFLGCYLDSGYHNITIYYNGKSWIQANWMKLIGLIFASTILIYYILHQRNGKIEKVEVSSNENNAHVLK